MKEVLNPRFYYLKEKFYNDAEEMGCHCPIKECGDAGCGIVGLEAYLKKAYFMGYKDAIKSLTPS